MSVARHTARGNNYLCDRAVDARDWCPDGGEGSAALRRALEALFRRWEKEHNMRPGAGRILLPAGWRGK